MKVGLFFGSFNPIHIGHIILANHMLEHTDLDEIWLIVTPHNPLKNKSGLLADRHRLHMAHLATEEYPNIKPSDIEFHLPQPNYTINTLLHLEEKYPKNEWVLLMGEDNIKSLPKWKNFAQILAHYQIYYYPRISDQTIPEALKNHPHIKRIEAPVIEISATQIRNDIKMGKCVLPLLPIKVHAYIQHNLFYKK